MLMLRRHAVLALLIAFGLSTYFWLVLDVFVLSGFVLMSLLSAAIGAGTGWLAGGRLWVTAVATIIVRITIFVLMTGRLPIPR